MRIRLVGSICALVFAAMSCGEVKPPAGAQHVCKFDADRFDAGCVLAP